MAEQQGALPQQSSSFDTPPTSSKKRLLFSIFFLFLVLLGGIYLVLSKKTAQPSTTITPTVTQTLSPTASETPAQTVQKNWKVFTPANHTFVSSDNSFQFVYPAEWAYETIDGILPQQQHIVNLGRQLTLTERQALAKNAGVELTDTLSGFSYTSADITLYYSNTLQVKKLEDLATGTILSKKQITVGNEPALEATVDCPTECKEILFTKGPETFVFLQARPRSQTTPLDTTKLTQIISTFTFAK